MHDELTARQRAISLRLAGRPVKHICSALGRTEAWFHKWWRRYLEAGPEGLYDLTRANHHVAQRIPPELERAILSVRRRLQAHATPATRYSLIGATAILAELKALDIRPLPSRAHHRARAAAQRPDRTAGPPRPAAAAPGVPRPAGPGLQRTPRGRSRGADLPQGQRPPLLHLGRQGRLRRRRLPAPGRLPPHGRGPLVPRRVLEGPGPAGAGPVRQRPRAGRLGAGGAHPVAGDPALPALRRQPRVHPGGGAAVQRQRGELQRLVPGAAVPTAASRGRATCGGSWRGCRRRSTRSTSTRGWGARRRRSTAGACGCRSCRRASWCRRGGCRWRRGA